MTEVKLARRGSRKRAIQDMRAAHRLAIAESRSVNYGDGMVRDYLSAEQAARECAAAVAQGFSAYIVPPELAYT